MILMNFLRILVDLSFYGAFAGFFALKCGGQGAFAGMLLQCVCFSLSSAAKKSRAPRMLLLLSMLLGFYWHRGSVADCVLLIPSAVYILRLAFKGDYALSQERQQQLFSVFWKALAIFTPLAMLMWDLRGVALVSVFFMMLVIVWYVFFMRARRCTGSVID